MTPPDKQNDSAAPPAHKAEIKDSGIPGADRAAAHVRQSALSVVLDEIEQRHEKYDCANCGTDALKLVKALRHAQGYIEILRNHDNNRHRNSATTVLEELSTLLRERDSGDEKVKEDHG